MKLFLALPVYGGYNAHFVHCLLELVAAKRDYPIVIRPHVGDSLVARARNNLAAQFLASDCTHLLFLDTDLIFSPAHITKLVEHARNGCGVVCGLYPKKQRELGWVCNILDSAEPPAEDGLQRVKYAGTGCMLIARTMFDVLRKNFPEIEYDPDEGDAPGVKWDFFATGVRGFEGRRRYLSEDWMFCQRVLDCGQDIWMDTTVILKHVGEFIYPLQDIDTFAEKV